MGEYYHRDFLQLVQELGYSEAVNKVEYYMKISQQYTSCQTFVIHNCNLLNTYQASNPPIISEKPKLSDLTDSGLWDYAKHRGFNEKWIENQIKQRNARRAKVHG